MDIAAKSEYNSMDAGTAQRFKYWQNRTIIATMVGYAMYYFVRKNLSIAMPAMQTDLGITKAELGIFLTLHGLMYGVSKFANGFIGDRVNARYFMVAGLVLSAICNVIFGFSSAVLVLGIVWVINGWVQGMGFPPCARLLTHWVPPLQLATKMSVWNISHSIGAGLIVVICGYVVTWGWEWCFFFPSILALLGALFLWVSVRDTPSSVGLPEITFGNDTGEGHKEDKKSASYKQFVRKAVFGNKYIWLISIANFFVYILRSAVLDWGPTLLKEWKHIPLTHAGWMIGGFEVAGVAGMLLAGWATDRLLGGRAIRTCFICMGMATLSMLIFWKLPSSSTFVSALLLMATGFFIYGPQALVSIAAANLATKRAAATAGGFTGLFGYASTVVSGWGFAVIVQKFGWEYALGTLIVMGVIGTIIFLLAWPAKAHGYDTK